MEAALLMVAVGGGPELATLSLGPTALCSCRLWETDLRCVSLSGKSQ